MQGAEVRRRAAAHLFVADVDRPVIDADDEHHVLRVLRLRPGEAVTVADGRGRWRPCRLASGGALDPDGEAALDRPAGPDVLVGFAPTKGERPEWAVAKLTELGIDRIQPLVAARSVVRWQDDRWDHHHAKWSRIVRQAAMQSRRTVLPIVEPPRSPAEVVAAVAGVALAEPGGGAPTGGLAGVLVGPEGGWSDEELASPCPTVDLGPTVLRTETAVVAAAVLCAAARWDIVRWSRATNVDHA